MQIDLSFQDAAAEAAFRRRRLDLLRPYGKAVEGTRMLISLACVARLAILQESRASIAAALLACLAVGAQLCVCAQEDLRCVGGRAARRVLAARARSIGRLPKRHHCMHSCTCAASTVHRRSLPRPAVPCRQAALRGGIGQ